MITILFHPGSYGTFIAWTIYNVSDLNKFNIKYDIFDNNGSSHNAKELLKANQIFKRHYEKDVKGTPVVITPSVYNMLDYMDNQYVKHANLSIANLEYFGDDEILSKIRKSYHIDSTTIDEVPTWMHREYTSFWINDVLHGTTVPFNATGYSVNRIFDDYVGLVKDIMQYLDLQLIASDKELETIHNNFIVKQQFHGSQARCDKWVDDIIYNVNGNNPSKTILDEAYIQAMLRRRGYGMYCDGLDEMPYSSKEMNGIIYKI